MTRSDHSLRLHPPPEPAGSSLCRDLRRLDLKSYRYHLGILQVQRSTGPPCQRFPAEGSCGASPHPDPSVHSATRSERRMMEFRSVLNTVQKDSYLTACKAQMDFTAEGEPGRGRPFYPRSALQVGHLKPIRQGILQDTVNLTVIAHDIGSASIMSVFGGLIQPSWPARIPQACSETR